jgi:predicted transcriptional regulator
MAQQQRIRSAYSREGKSVTEVAEEYGSDRKTVRKYITKDDWSRQTAEDQASRLTLMDTVLRTALSAAVNEGALTQTDADKILEEA